MAVLFPLYRSSVRDNIGQTGIKQTSTNITFSWL